MRFLLFILGFWATSQLMAREVDQERARAAKLEREGNWKEALELRESLLAEVVDEGSGKDLEAWTRAAGRLGKWERFDGLVQRVLERQGENRAFLLSAARVYEGAPGHGVILDGEFLRGQRMARGAQWHSVAEQNRVFAMRFARLAWERSETAGERVEALEVLARVLQRGRTGRGQSWLLADLTDLSAWPDWTEEVSLGTGDGAAVDEEGKPREFALPENWEAAASDGERWRWLRAEIRRLDAAAGARADWEWWSFCEGQYGVGTLAGFSWWRRMESEAMEGVLQVESLREDESVARLAEGVTRFHLPESYQYLKGFRELMREGKGGVYERAGDRLVGIFLNRRQRVAAAEVLAEVIERHGAGDEERRKKLRAQITEGWGRFGQTGSFFAGEPVRVPFTSRNAGEVALSLRAIDDELVMRDIFAYLEGKEGEIQRDDLDHEKMDLGRIGSRLLAENLPKYLAAEGRDWVAELEKKPAHADSLNELELGNLAPGAYWLRAEMGGRVLGWTVLWVRDLVLMQREEKAGQVFYLMDGEKGAAVRGEIDFLGYRVTHRRVRGLLGREVRKMELEVERLKGETDEAGRFVIGGKEKLERLDDFQWSAMARAGERVAFLQQMRWHWNEGGFEGYQSQKSYGISDRPVYRPGQQVQLKFWSAEARYDLGDEWKYAGKAARVEVRDAKGEVVFEQKNLRTDVFGGLTVAFDLPEDAALGAYRVDLAGAVPSGFLSFRVEEYKKPEFEVVVEGPEEPVVLGGKFQAKVRALYYHGAPVSEAEVRVHVTRQAFDEVWFPAGPWDWLYGAGYWWFSPEYRHLRGWSQWGCVRPAPPWWRGGRHQPEEEVMDRTLAIGLDGTVEVEIDTKLAQFVHGDEDHRYRITAEVVDASRRMISGSGTVLAARQPFQVTTWLDRGYARTGERVTGSFAVRTLDGKEVAHEAEATLFRLLTNEKGEVDEKEVRRWAVEGGKVDFEASEAGQFRLAIKAKDKAGREASGAAVLTVLGEATEGEFAFNDLELIPDRKSYAPGDSLRLLVNVREPGSRVLLFVRPGQGAAEERLDFVVGGQSQVVEIPLTQADMPNIFLEGLVLRKGGLQRVTREIVLPPETRQLQVEVEPAAEKLKPREKTKLRVRLRDAAGQPFQGQAVVTVYDKSLEYISGGSNVPGMMPYFWDWKRHYYARGGRTSQNQSGGHLVKEGQEIMRNLGLFGGPEFAPRQEGAVLGAAMGGMELTARKSAGAVMPMAAPAMEADSAMSEMALAEPEGGEPEVMVRSEFADLLKWVGELETDERGEAEIELEMPDNLTTWKVRVWALGAGTRVGEGSAEVVTSKDLLVRLQAPRFFVEKDEVTLSAIVHNYHEEAKEVRVSLELDGGLLENESAEAREVAIAPGGESRVDWTVRTRGEGEATVRVKAVAADDADAMEMRFPVFIHGMERTESFSVALGRGQESARIPFEVPEKRRAAESELIVRYAPSVAVAMVEALPYLARYPYGCTEQTLNRFVPTVVVRDLLEDLQVDLAAVKTAREGLNPQNLPGGGAEELRRKREGGWNPVWDAAEVAKMEREGIAKLAEDQNSDGGWGWFSAFGERSYPHTTAVVVHGLLLAKSHGAAVPEEMMQRGVAWLEKHETGELERLRNWENGKAKERKKSADALDALIRRLLGEAGVENAAMRDFLFRDKVNLPVYAKCLLGLELHRVGQVERRDAVLRNIEQFLQLDEENQTAWLELPNRGYWWFWYGGEIEAQAWYLKLLAAVKPESPQAAGLAKYLVNNRKGGTYWKSTRDTAYCLEALGDFLRASGEAAAELEVEILIDGKLVKTEKLTPENLFTSEKTVRVAGDVLTGGAHEIEVRKKGAGPLYVNAWLKVFTLEDHLQKAGLEVKVERRFYKLEPKKGENLVPDARGGLVREKAGGFERVLLQEGDELRSGDLVEVELSIESKNDYEYLLFEDWKAAGLEAVEVRSGYNAKGLGAYMELRDEKVSLFVQNLPRGRHNLSYRLRAEIPGKFSALPTRAEAMYAPELKANSDEMKILVRD